MLRLYLDPIVFASPLRADPFDKWDLYRDTLINIYSLNQFGFLKVLVSLTTLSVLESLGLAPHYAKAESPHYMQLKDIVRTATEILSKRSQIEMEAGVSEILLDATSCEPTDHLLGRPAKLVDSYHRLVALVAIDGIRNLVSQEDQFVLTRGIGPNGHVVQGKGEIVDVEYLNCQTSIALDKDYHIPLFNCSRTCDLDVQYAPVSVWLDQTNPRRFEEAIKLAIKQREAYGDTGEVTSALAIRILPAFPASLTDTGFGHEVSKIEALIRVCADTLLRVNMAKVHALRAGLGAGNPQRLRKRDGAKGWRRDITYEYHLHYWLSDTAVEFANVVVHEDFGIDE